MKKIAVLLLLPGLLLADFRYDTTTKVTKGFVLRMPFGKKPEPTSTTHYYKGSRMAMVTGNSTTVIDFDKQMFTHIDTEKKQYWQSTFAEMQQMMAEMQSNMAASTNNQAQMQWKVDGKSTGVEKEVGGVMAKQFQMTMETVVSDERTKQRGMAMKMVNDSWHSEKIPGYKEYMAFYERLKDKGSWANMNSWQQMAGQPGMAEGMKKMAEEMAKVPGVPVLTITRMYMPGMNMPDMSSMGSASGGANGQAPNVNAGDAAKSAGGQAAGGAAGRAIGGNLGGALGGALGRGLGGFGKKRQQEAPPAETPAPAPAKKEVPADAGDGLMMETVADSSNFSTAAISEDVFAIPAGYQKVESGFAKARRK